ncbi:MAG: hypothetical protein AAGC93_19830 [Cyanobacteria bacterium P01_F01_bin.53]
MSPALFLERLFEEGWKIIYLTRENKVDQVISNLISQERGKWHKTTSEEEKIEITVDCNILAAKIHERIRFERAERESLRNVDFLEIVYDDELKESSMHQATSNKVFEYLALEPTDVYTPYMRINTFNLEKIITNYNDFLKCIRKNGWENFI